MPVCKICGLEEHEHHNFEPRGNSPKGCKCDVDDWRDPTNIPPVCSSFKPDPEWPQQCLTCEHGDDCHAIV
jgi:hypothetical protein